MTFHFSFFELGFNKAEIQKFLLKNNIEISLVRNLPDKASPETVDTLPTWAPSLSPMSVFTVEQASLVLAGDDPYCQNPYRQDYDNRDFIVARDILSQAINDGKLNATGEYTNYQVRHDDLRNYVGSIGLKWPIPAIPNEVNYAKNFSEDHAIGEIRRLAKLNSDLETQLQTANDAIKIEQGIEQKLIEAKAEIVRLEAENAGIKHRLTVYSSDDLKPLDRPTALKLIGAFALDSSVDIHGSRFNMAETQRNLQRYDVSISNDTLRKWLRLAADVVVKPAV